jgi:predicted short-subunit dehydrogenase-like oxidoreductase (DUF2520 family)
VIARTPNVFVVGSGPVAATLAGALRRAGAPVLGLWGRTAERVRQAGSSAGVATFSAAPPDLLLEADVVILAVRDDAIGEVARTLVATGLITRRHVFLHCSGVISAAEAFGDVVSSLGGVGTIHPLRSITDPRQTIAALRGTLFGVEGDAEGRATSRRLVELLGGKPLDLDGDGMALYHAAASIASNYLVALVDAGAEALAAAGMPRGEALPALLPLAAGTIENLGREGIPRALTGPIARGDAGTIERHLRALRERAPGLLELYAVAGRRAVAIARARGDAPAEALDRIERALADQRPDK